MPFPVLSPLLLYLSNRISFQGPFQMSLCILLFRTSAPRCVCSPFNVRCIFMFALCLCCLLCHTPTEVSEVWRSGANWFWDTEKGRHGKRVKEKTGFFLRAHVVRKFSIIGSGQEETEWLHIGNGVPRRISLLCISVKLNDSWHPLQLYNSEIHENPEK